MMAGFGIIKHKIFIAGKTYLEMTALYGGISAQKIKATWQLKLGSLALGVERSKKVLDKIAIV